LFLKIFDLVCSKATHHPMIKDEIDGMATTGVSEAIGNLFQTVVLHRDGVKISQVRLHTVTYTIAGDNDHLL
jgi:hypothetical protein